MLGSICVLALVIELDFFIALQKFGAMHFGAPDDIKEMMKKVPDKPIWVTVIGIIIMILSLLGILGILTWSIVDTYCNYPGFYLVLTRYLIILWGYKLFDVVCFDWLLLTKIRLPEKLCPETKGAKGYSSFGFNAKSQLIKLGVFLLIAIGAAFIFYLVCK